MHRSTRVLTSWPLIYTQLRMLERHWEDNNRTAICEFSANATEPKCTHSQIYEMSLKCLFAITKRGGLDNITVSLMTGNRIFRKRASDVEKRSWIVSHLSVPQNTNHFCICQRVSKYQSYHSSLTFRCSKPRRLKPKDMKRSWGFSGRLKLEQNGQILFSSCCREPSFGVIRRILWQKENLQECNSMQHHCFPCEQVPFPLRCITGVCGIWIFFAKKTFLKAFCRFWWGQQKSVKLKTWHEWKSTPG